MKKELKAKFEQYRSLPSRQDLERSMTDAIIAGAKSIDMYYKPTPWIVSVATFFEWYFQVKSGIAATKMSKEAGIYDAVLDAFRKEVM